MHVCILATSTRSQKHAQCSGVKPLFAACASMRQPRSMRGKMRSASLMHTYAMVYTHTLIPILILL